MNKLMLEAFAAWLALAAVSGQACASIQTGANSLSTMASRGDGVLNTVDTGVALSPLLPGGAGRSHGRSTEVGADDSTPGRKNGYGTELKRRAVFKQHDVVGASRSQGVLVVANGGSGQIKGIQTVQDGDLDAEKFYPIANAKLAPGPTVPVPEPGNWATVLAGLLGVIAIARRRMSL